MNIHFDSEGTQLGTSSGDGVKFKEEVIKKFIQDFNDEKDYQYKAETEEVIEIDKIDHGSARESGALAATEYIQTRRETYKEFGEQLDQMYWDQVNGTTTWKNAIAKVKSDNPKPE